MITIPETFLNKYLPLVDDQDAFIEILSNPLRRSFRVNPLKGETQQVIDRMTKSGIHCTPAPWYTQAFTIESDQLSSTLERFLGTIYIQELASMLPPLIVRDELQQPLNLLDCCAAPGSKTTLTAALMNNRGTIIANDRSYSRIRGLKFNIDKTGVTNTIITNFPLSTFPNAEFDLVMLDAPCSSDGTARKNPNLYETWTPKRCLPYASRQKQLILRAFELLKKDGLLVYSTCSFAPEENELVIDYLLQQHNATLEKISLPDFIFSKPVFSWQGYEFHPEVKKAVRVWPHLNNTDGFFIAKVRK